MVGVNLSMLQNLQEWNPFDLLLERDSSEAVRPDLVFLTEQPPVPVVGLILVHPQNEYGARGRHQQANEAAQRLIDSREMAVVPIDTRLDDNQVGLRSAGEVEALITRMDAVITTRLHGMVMAIKNGVPPLVLDPIAGGAKIVRQAQAIDWPLTFLADEVSDEQLQAGLAFCLSPQGRAAASQTRDRARDLLRDVRARFVAGIHELAHAGV
jgi:hypothetical protein